MYVHRVTALLNLHNTTLHAIVSTPIKLHLDICFYLHTATRPGYNVFMIVRNLEVEKEMK